MIRGLQLVIRNEISLIRRKNVGLPDDWGRTWCCYKIEKVFPPTFSPHASSPCSKKPFACLIVGGVVALSINLPFFITNTVGLPPCITAFPEDRWYQFLLETEYAWTKNRRQKRKARLEYEILKRWLYDDEMKKKEKYQKQQEKTKSLFTECNNGWKKTMIMDVKTQCKCVSRVTRFASTFPLYISRL